MLTGLVKNWASAANFSEGFLTGKSQRIWSTELGSYRNLVEFRRMAKSNCGGMDGADCR